MEVVIPPRDHDAQSAYRYRWDENGEVTRVTRVSALISPRRARQTVQWPYQSFMPATPTRSSIFSLATSAARRKTWQPRSAHDDDNDTIFSPVEIPDYVVNFLKGETPETIAQKKLDRKLQEVQNRNAVFGGDSGSFADSAPRSPPASANDDDEQILLSFGEKPPSGRRFEVAGHGWRGGIALLGLLSLLILLVGLGGWFAVIAEGAFSNGDGGVAAVFTGSCSMAARIDMGLHALTNVLIVGLIAGANYTFQVLSSPTRRELDNAHSMQRWLDIGIPSIRNFRHISKRRVIFSVMILLAAATIPTLYNGVIFTSQPAAADYQLLFVTPSFLDGAPFSNASEYNAGDLDRLDILALQALASRDQLVNLTSSECVEEFGGFFDPNFKAALVVVTGIDSPDSALLQTATGMSYFSSSVLFPSVQGNSPTRMMISASNVAFCLAEPATAQACTVNISAAVLGSVLLLNMAILAAFACAFFFLSSFQPLATLGDAIGSFLREPDPTTRGACLMTKPDVWHGRWGLRGPKYWVPRDHYWFRTPSLPRWLLASFLWLCLAGLASAALGLTTRADPNGVLSPFGVASPHSVYVLPAKVSTTVAAVLAALPQLLLAMLYLATNSLVTTFFLSHESSLFALGTARPLRVSANPRGAQTTSLFLTLPRFWSGALLLLFAGLGFVLSQAVSVVAVSGSGSGRGGAALGFSGVALLAFLALLAALAALVLGLGCRRAAPAVLVNGQAVGNPLVLAAGSCSAVISARCHRDSRSERVPRDAWCRPLMWGVVDIGDAVTAQNGVGHCGYSAGTTAQLDISRSYA